MYKTMLVPLDGSKLAEVVFIYAKELAGRLDLDLVLLHVCSPQESEAVAMHEVYLQRAAEILTHESREVQRSTGVEAGGKTVDVRTEVAVGHSAEEILRYADENSMDLILMANHGGSGVGRWVIGGVADKVLRASTVPVWLVPADVPGEVVYDKWPRRTILVPLDVSEVAETVLPHVETLAKQRGREVTEIVLLGVCEPVPRPAYYLSTFTWDDHCARSKRLNEHYLARVRKRLEDVGLKVRSEVLVGKPADGIVEYANRNPFNLIVMATRGRSGLTWWDYGSVTNKVLQAASRPILLVRPP
jgi:nucleotide-binding universal stress UspA family protein